MPAQQHRAIVSFSVDNMVVTPTTICGLALPLFPAQPRHQRVNSTNTAKQFIAVKKRLQRLICCHGLLGNNEAVFHVLD